MSQMLVSLSPQHTPARESPPSLAFGEKERRSIGDVVGGCGGCEGIILIHCLLLLLLYDVYLIGCCYDCFNIFVICIIHGVVEFLIH